MTLLMRDQENIEKGMEQVIINMHKKGFPVDRIAKAVDRSVEDVQTVMAGREVVLV